LHRLRCCILRLLHLRLLHLRLLHLRHYRWRRWLIGLRLIIAQNQRAKCLRTGCQPTARQLACAARALPVNCHGLLHLPIIRVWRDLTLVPLLRLLLRRNHRGRPAIAEQQPLPLKLTQTVQLTLHLDHLLLHGVDLRCELAKLLLDTGIAATTSTTAARAHFMLQPDDPVVQRIPLIGLCLGWRAGHRSQHQQRYSESPAQRLEPG
jgi:hypothetical protein